LNDWRAFALVAIASRKNGEHAAAKPKKFGRRCARLRIGAYVLAPPFSACSTHQCRELLRHHRVANQP
jgi:hypothetical protein